METAIAKVPKIKICGIRTQAEVEIINEAGVEYVGIVFYKKSKRYVEIEKSNEIIMKLNQNIIKVAVTANPNQELVKQIENAGFDILQVHGELTDEVEHSCNLPIWRGVNLATTQMEIKKQLKEAGGKMGNQKEKHTSSWQGILFDAKEYGSGKTFDWKNFSQNAGSSYQEFREKLTSENKTFILAGGLSNENVREGIRLFSPDVVDVSTGVEDCNGKSREKIFAFVNAVRKMEEL